MIYYLYFFIFLTPLGYIQAKIPNGPKAISYQYVSLMLLTLFWAYRAQKKGRSGFRPSPLNLAILAYLVYAYLGMFLSSVKVPGFPLPLTTSTRSMQLYLMQFISLFYFFLALNLVETRKELWGCLGAIGLSMLLVFRAFRSDLSMHSTAVYTDKLRAAGPFVWCGSNELAAHLLVGCLFFAIFAWSQRAWWQKSAMLFVSALYGYGVLFSYSRGAQLSLIAASTLLVVLRYRWVLPILLLAGVTYQMWVPASVQERWAMTENENGQLESSAESRKEFWDLAMDNFMSDPVFGTGFQSFRYINPAKMDTHNLYMRVLTEQGVVGIAVLFWIWGCVLKIASDVWRRAKSAWDRQFGFALFIATIGLMLANIFGDRFSYTEMIGQYWVLVGLCMRLHLNMTGEAPFLDDAPAAEDATDPETPATAPGRAPAWGATGALGPATVPAFDLRPAGAVPLARSEARVHLVGGQTPTPHPRQMPKVNRIEAPAAPAQPAPAPQVKVVGREQHSEPTRGTPKSHLNFTPPRSIS